MNEPSRHARLLAVLSTYTALLAPAAASFAYGAELTAFGGYRFGGEFEDSSSEQTLRLDEGQSHGLLLSLDDEVDTQLEFLWSRQTTGFKENQLFSGAPLFNLDVDYYQVGGTKFWYVPARPWFPFISGTLGVTHMRPQGPNLHNETRFSMSLGGGVKLPFNQHVGLRIDVRGYATFMDGGSNLFCAGGRCTLQVSSGGFWQAETSAGIYIAF
jgi:hypothetical protein